MDGAGADIGGTEPSGSESTPGESEKGGESGATDTSKPASGANLSQLLQS